MFCPKCGSILIPKEKRHVCSCGYSTKEKEEIKLKEKTKEKKLVEVISKTIETDPKTSEECPKCENKEAYYWLVQTRAADEAETRFFKCTKCGYKWRSYT